LNQTIAMTFLIGGALAGAAGVFQGQYFGFVRWHLDSSSGLKAFTAAVLGGIGNLTGAAIGGFLIAFIEVFAQSVGQARWSQAIVFRVLIIFLVCVPAGILCQQIGERPCPRGCGASAEPAAPTTASGSAPSRASTA